jgi:RHS repeat-associated protein
MKRVFYLLWLFPLLVFAEIDLISIDKNGSIQRIFEDGLLIRVERLSVNGEVRYFHEYVYDEKGMLIEEKLIGDLGSIYYSNDSIESEFLKEQWSCNESGLTKYIVDLDDDVQVENNSFSYWYDDKGQLSEKDGLSFTYDENERLISAISDDLVAVYYYDDEGRRILKQVNGEEEHYLYLANIELGVTDKDGRLKNLKVPGYIINEYQSRPISIETEEGVFAPIHNIQGNIVKLVNMRTKNIVKLQSTDVFGVGLQKEIIPWQYKSKHFDSETKLVYFGGRYYSPELMKWITRDPLKQCSDLHNYCFNDPVNYHDPTGFWATTFFTISWLEGAGLVLSSPFWGPYAVAAVAGSAIGYGVYKGYEYWQESSGNNRDLIDPDDTPFDSDKVPEIGRKKPPADGFILRGGDKGSWVRETEDGREILYPDINHPPPIQPHWDYTSKKYPQGIRIYPDGTIESKKRKK